MKHIVIDIIVDSGSWLARPMRGMEIMKIDGKDVYGTGRTIRECLLDLAERWADYAVDCAIKNFNATQEPSGD